MIHANESKGLAAVLNPYISILKPKPALEMVIFK
jgi:hypothetical protein